MASKKGVEPVLPRRIAGEGEARPCTVRGGNLVCQWAAAVAPPTLALREAGFGPAGNPASSAAIRGWLNFHVGLHHGWQATDETKAVDRRSMVFIDGHRINNGRGERVYDAVLPDKNGQGVPVSLKAGDARDGACGKALAVVRACVEAGAPVIMGILSDDGSIIGHSFKYHTNERLDFPAPRKVQVAWYDLSAIVSEHLATWDMVESVEGVKGPPVVIRPDYRQNKVEVDGWRAYPRLSFNLDRLKAECGLEPIKVEPWIPGIKAPI